MFDSYLENGRKTAVGCRFNRIRLWCPDKSGDAVSVCERKGGVSDQRRSDRWRLSDAGGGWGVLTLQLHHIPPLY